MITDAVEVPDMTKSRAVLVSLMDQYLRGLLDPFVTLLEVHKLMYFMQKAGEPLKLELLQGPLRSLFGESETCSSPAGRSSDIRLQRRRRCARQATQFGARRGRGRGGVP